MGQRLTLPRTPPPRGLMVTLLAWLTIVCSGLLIPISVISLLMILSGGYGSQTSDPAGFFIVIIAPPLTFVAGLGLLFRWRWARYYMFVLLAVFIAANVKELASGGKTTTIRTTASGVVTTSEDVWGGPNRHSVPIIVFCTAALVLLCLPSVRREFQPVRKSAVPAVAAEPEAAPPPLPGRQWRVGHRGRDMMYYEEFHDGAWQRLDVDGEMLTGRAHHVIYFASPATWQTYPEWARHRRGEIVARIKSEFREPDYEYHGDPGQPEVAVSAAPVPPPAVAPPPSPQAPPAVSDGKPWALPVALAVLFGFSVWMGWLVKDGLDQGVVRDVFKGRVVRTPPARAEEPARFWFLVGVCSVACVGSAGLGVWMVVVWLRPEDGATRGTGRG